MYFSYCNNLYTIVDDFFLNCIYNKQDGEIYIYLPNDEKCKYFMSNMVRYLDYSQFYRTEESTVKTYKQLSDELIRIEKLVVY